MSGEEAGSATVSIFYVFVIWFCKLFICNLLLLYLLYIDDPRVLIIITYICYAISLLSAYMNGVCSPWNVLPPFNASVLKTPLRLP